MCTGRDEPEGVETNEQLSFLRLLRCDEMQGYLFSKPVSAEQFKQKFLDSSPVNTLSYDSD